MKQIGFKDSKPIMEIKLDNGQISVTLLSFGGVIQSLKVKDQKDYVRDVVLGFNDWKDYIDQEFFIGTVIGRVANRINGASFKIHEKLYKVETNEGINHLHGGSKGFWNTPFDVLEYSSDFVVLRYLSKDGEGGYPGNLETQIIFSIAEKNLLIDYYSASDQDTVVNLTHHDYFNLEKDHSTDITKETLIVYADKFTEIDDTCSVTGKIISVERSPFDFRNGAVIRDRIFAVSEQMTKGSGLNHNFVLTKPLDSYGPVAELVSSDGLLGMRIESDQPGVQVYSGNYLDSTLIGKSGERYKQFAGICLETQNFPDAVNRENFPSPRLKKGRLYHQKTKYTFYFPNSVGINKK